MGGTNDINPRKPGKALLMALSLDCSRTSHSRYYGNTKQRHANHNRLHPIAAHRRRQTRTFKIAHTARHDHGSTRPSQARSFGKYRSIYCSLRRVRAELC